MEDFSQPSAEVAPKFMDRFKAFFRRDRPLADAVPEAEVQPPPGHDFSKIRIYANTPAANAAQESFHPGLFKFDDLYQRRSDRATDSTAPPAARFHLRLTRTPALEMKNSSETKHS